MPGFSWPDYFLNIDHFINHFLEHRSSQDTKLGFMATTAWLCLITVVKINFAVILNVCHAWITNTYVRSIQTCDSVSNFRSHFRLNDLFRKSIHCFDQLVNGWRGLNWTICEIGRSYFLDRSLWTWLSCLTG